MYPRVFSGMDLAVPGFRETSVSSAEKHYFQKILDTANNLWHSFLVAGFAQSRASAIHASHRTRLTPACELLQVV